MNEKMLKIVQGVERLYPHALEKQFPGIMNKIIKLWDTPQLEEYILELMTDRRANLQGFPKEVATEIFYLDQVYERTRKISNPDGNNPWGGISPSGSG
jgi:hypothetical protein